MRDWPFACVVFLLGLLPGTSPAQAEPPAGPMRDVAPWAQQTVTDGNVPVENGPAQALGVGQQHFVAGQVLAGLETGVRAQVAVWHEGNHSYLLEVCRVGLFGNRFAEGYAGGGGRVDFTVLGSDVGSVIVAGPGINLWTMSPGKGLALVPSVDVALLHDFVSHFGWEIGANLGCAYVWGAPGERDRLLPVVSFYVGLRF
jgi:hypothetical protein